MSLCGFLFVKNNTQIEILKAEQTIQTVRADSLSQKVDSLQEEIIRLRETHPYQSRKWKSRKTGLCTQGNFFGFLLYTPVDTTISKDFAYVLSTYSGPKAKVTSVKRYNDSSSRHYHGKAIDLAWDEELIAFLISEEGTRWLTEHDITLYIEGAPGSKKVRKYLDHPQAAQYCFFNKNATGDHIHMNI